MVQVQREVVAAFDTAEALEDAVYALETKGFDRAAFSLLANEETVERKLGQRYRRVEDMEDNPAAPRETFFSHASRLEADILPTPLFASVGALMFAGSGFGLAALVAAGSGAVLGAALSGLLYHHNAERVREQLERGGLLLWVNVRNAQDVRTATEVLAGQHAHDVHVHEVHPFAAS